MKPDMNQHLANTKFIDKANNRHELFSKKALHIKEKSNNSLTTFCLCAHFEIVFSY